MNAALLTLAWLAGCTGAEPAPVVRAAHYARFDHLVDAASEGDVDGAKALVGDLVEGDVADGDGAEQVGAAMGFLRMAEDRSEVAEAVARMAAGCGACHRARGVDPVGHAPGWTPATAARQAVWDVVWSRRTDGASVLPEPLRSAATEPDPVARAMALLAASHGETGNDR